MIVTWSTFSYVEESIVEYGIDQLILQANGSSRLLVNPQIKVPFFSAQYIHKVIVSGLKPGTKYGKYACFNFGNPFLIVFFDLSMILLFLLFLVDI